MKPPRSRERAETDKVLHAERDRIDATLRASLLQNADDQRARRLSDRALTALSQLRNLAPQHESDAKVAALDGLVIPVDVAHVPSSARHTGDQQEGSSPPPQWEAFARGLEIDRALTDRLLTTERTTADRTLATRDDVLGTVSHDMRGMVAIIALNASLIEDDANGQHEAIVECANDIKTLSSRMLRLIDDLTDFVRIEAGVMNVRPVPGDAAVTLRRVCKVFAPMAAAHGIELTVEQTPESMLAVFDNDRISQVLSNLLGNAIKFIHANGHIKLSARRRKKSIVFSVSDDGPGIAPDKLDMIFERFWQAGGRSAAGLGLGLFISRRLVEAHGGRIWAHRRAEGRGSTFLFTIPAP